MSSQFALSAVFGDHMVLQREQPLRFWGRGLPGARVELGWATPAGALNAETEVDAQGAWQLELPAQPAGGPHELEFRGPERLTLRDVWLGDIWLASGQSNMEWTVAQSAFVEEELALATQPKLRWLFVERRPEKQPSREAHCSWRLVTPDGVARMTAIGYAFARKLCAELDVAVGIIDASWGGTPVEAWTSPEALGQVMDLERELRGLQAEERDLDALRLAYADTLRAWEKAYLVQDERNAGEAAGWHESEPAWDAPTLAVPSIWQRHGMLFNGAVWFRRDVELPPDWASPSTLCLGRIDDFDHTYVNGVLVGAHPQGTPLSIEIVREYPLQPGVLKPGRNSIAVRIFDHAGEGGFLDAARSLYLESATGERIQLAGDWQYRVEREVPLVPVSVWRHFPQPPRVLRPHYLPTRLFNGMIAPLLPLGLRGVIWYQGEANVAEHELYMERFSALIRDWQRRFGGAEGVLPFYFVQLASFRESGKWAYLREAQAQTLRLPNTGMVVTLDIGDANDIHPRNKREVGRRLAQLALSHTYGKQLGPVRGPLPTRVDVDGGELCVEYAEQAALATADGGTAVSAFEVESDDGRLHAAQARLVGQQVRVSIPFSGRARGLRYAFCDVPEVNLVNSAGLPAEPFRWALDS